MALKPGIAWSEMTRSQLAVVERGDHLLGALGAPVLGLVSALAQGAQDQLRVVLGVLEKQDAERAAHASGRGSGGDSFRTSQ